MPYIAQESRAVLDPRIANLVDKISGAGALNYAITKLCLGAHLHVDGYQRIAELTGVLENVKQEFYRRKASVYEDTKIKENGDVYQP